MKIISEEPYFENGYWNVEYDDGTEPKFKTVMAFSKESTAQSFISTGRTKSLLERIDELEARIKVLEDGHPKLVKLGGHVDEETKDFFDKNLKRGKYKEGDNYTNR